MRGEAAPYSLVPSEESSLLHEREGDQQGELSIKTGPTPEKKRRSEAIYTRRGWCPRTGTDRGKGSGC